VPGRKPVFAFGILKDQLCRLLAADVNKATRDDVGREGFDYWQILVLAIVRLGCMYSEQWNHYWMSSPAKIP
jgi:hypothetical protein